MWRTTFTPGCWASRRPQALCNPEGSGCTACHRQHNDVVCGCHQLSRWVAKRGSARSAGVRCCSNPQARGFRSVLICSAPSPTFHWGLSKVRTLALSASTIRKSEVTGARCSGYRCPPFSATAARRLGSCSQHAYKCPSRMLLNLSKSIRERSSAPASASASSLALRAWHGRVEEYAGCSFIAQSLNIGLNSDDKCSSQ